MIKKMLLIGAIGMASLVSVKVSSMTTGTGPAKKVTAKVEVCGVQEAKADCNPTEYPHIECACGCCYECENWTSAQCWGC